MTATRVETYVPQKIRAIPDDCDRACTSILRDLTDRDDNGERRLDFDLAAMLLRLEVREAHEELRRLVGMWQASAA